MNLHSISTIQVIDITAIHSLSSLFLLILTFFPTHFAAVDHAAGAGSYSILLGGVPTLRGSRCEQTYWFIVAKVYQFI